MPKPVLGCIAGVDKWKWHIKNACMDKTFFAIFLRQMKMETSLWSFIE